MAEAREISMTPRGEAAAFIDGGALVLARLDADQRLALDVPAPQALAFAGDELWAAAPGALYAFSLDGRALRAPLALPAGPVRLVGARGPAAIWAGRWHIIADARGWTVHELDAPSLAGAEQLLPAAEHRLLAVWPERVLVCTEQGRVLVECAMPPRARASAAAPILGGRATAVLARAPEGDLLVVHDWSGRRVRIVRPWIDGARYRAIAFAEDAAIAIAATDTELIAIDLRLGETRAATPAPFPIDELAVSANGTSLVVAGARSGGRRPIAHLDAAQWQAPSTAAASPPEPDEDAPLARASESRPSDARTPAQLSEARASEARASESWASEARASEVRASEARASEARASESWASEVRASESWASEVRPSDARTPAQLSEARASEVRASEVRASEVRASEVRASEVRASEARASEARASESWPSEAGVSEARASEARASEVRASEVRASVSRTAGSMMEAGEPGAALLVGAGRGLDGGAVGLRGGRARGARREPAPAPAPVEERDARIAEALERATCHAGLLYERLVFAGRATGLVPPAASEADPLGALTVSDDDVSSMLASLRRVGAAPRGDARRAVPDPYDGLIAGSRAQLRAALERAEGCGLGLALAVRAFALDDAQLDALLVALAPDLDLRFGRVAGYLNNDTTRCRPTLGHLALAAQPGAAAGIDLRAQQALEAALLRPGLLERDDDGRTPAAGQAMRVPAHAVDLLATDVTTAAGEAVAWDALAWAPADRERLRTDLTRELARPRVERLVLVCGAPGAGRATIARAAATELGLPLVLVELEPASEAGDPRRRAALVGAVLRARLAGAALAIRWRPAPGETQLRVLHASARELDVPCLVLMGAGDLERIEPDVPFVRFDAPVVAASARRGLWARGLAAHGLGAAPRVLDDLATRYPLTPGRLGETVAELGARKAWIAGTAPVANAVADGCETVHDRPSERLDRLDVAITVEDVRETLGSITVGRLAHLARRHRAAIRLDDLAFPEAVSSRIAELIHRVELRRRVLSDWAFADKAHDGYGVSALFVGPPGTGKTAAAAAIANALHIDLYVVDLSRIMSKWVGETEQNLAQVFDEAEASSAALLFDEADALFGKRTVEQKGASDRYANLTINYLLQRMESFGGLAILTTNLMSAMDAAFQRRITSMVHFPPSDHDMRVQLWRKLLPAGARFGADVELDRLARDHVMEAAHIRRALVRAAFRAASRGQREAVLDARDLAWAAAAEYEDMGRIAHRERGDARPPVHRVNDHGGYR